MTAPQLRFYRVLWGQVRAVLRARKFTSGECEARRHEIHVEALGYDRSSLALTNAEFDKVKAAFLAITKPASLATQLAQQEMPVTRLRRALGFYLAALEEGEEYAESIVQRMNRERRLGAAGVTLEDLGAEPLKKVLFAVKDQCRRRWPKKADLLGEIYGLRREQDFDEEVTLAAVLAALNREHLGRGLDYLVYEDLLFVLAALRGLAKKAEEKGVLQEADIPF